MAPGQKQEQQLIEIWHPPPKMFDSFPFPRRMVLRRQVVFQPNIVLFSTTWIHPNYCRRNWGLTILKADTCADAAKCHHDRHRTIRRWKQKLPFDLYIGRPSIGRAPVHFWGLLVQVNLSLFKSKTSYYLETLFCSETLWQGTYWTASFPSWSRWPWKTLEGKESKTTITRKLWERANFSLKYKDFRPDRSPF